MKKEAPDHSRRSEKIVPITLTAARPLQCRGIVYDEIPWHWSVSYGSDMHLSPQKGWSKGRSGSLFSSPPQKALELEQAPPFCIYRMRDPTLIPKFTGILFQYLSPLSEPCRLAGPTHSGREVRGGGRTFGYSCLSLLLVTSAKVKLGHVQRSLPLTVPGKEQDLESHWICSLP